MKSLQIDSYFWMAVGLIFFVTLFGALARRLKRDRCLLLFNRHHVTLATEGKDAVTGVLNVTSRGVEVMFDGTPGQTTDRWRKGLLIYDQELAGCVTLCRIETGLTEAERPRRGRQIARLVDPDFLQRADRQLINFVNIVRDAIIQSIGLFLGKLGGGSGGLQTLAREQSSRLTELSGNVLGLFNNAYEPLLERHIGRLVVLTVRVQEKPEPMETDFYGYLADYNERFIVLLNPEQLLTDVLNGEVKVTGEVAGGKIERTPSRVTFACSGSEALILEEVRVGDRVVAGGVALLKGQRFSVPCVLDQPVYARVKRTASVDLLCPRTCAQVRYLASNGMLAHQGQAAVDLANPAVG